MPLIEHRSTNKNFYKVARLHTSMEKSLSSIENKEKNRKESERESQTLRSYSFEE